tara:strand:+ start:369 stop:581 length:213 start_codon:yes stop_codon:yes gene_type:complete
MKKSVTINIIRKVRVNGILRNVNIFSINCVIKSFPLASPLVKNDKRGMSILTPIASKKPLKNPRPVKVII